MAIAADGDAVVVWNVANQTTPAIWTNRFDHVTGWGTASQVAPVTTNTAYAVVAIDSGGIPHVAWADDAVRVTRYTGSAWASPQPIGTGGNLRMIADGTGNVTLVWLNTNVETSRWNGSAWSSSALVSDGTGTASYPEVAIDGAGNLLVAWGQSVGNDFNTRDAWVNRYTQGSGWGTPTKIESDSARLAESVAVAMDPDGDAVVAWWACASSVCDLRANRYVVGVGWRGAATIATDTGYVAAAIDGDHAPLVVWSSYNTVSVLASEY